MKRLSFLRLVALPLAGFVGGVLACLTFFPEPGPVASSPPPPGAPRPPTPDPHRSSGSKSGTPVPVRQAELTAEGYAAAGDDLAAALTRARNTTDMAERRALIQGVFAWVARNRSPGEGIQLAQGQEEGYYRNVALGIMVQQWSGKAEPPSADADGFSIRAAEALFYSQITPRAAADAWLTAFSGDPERAAIATAYAGTYLVGEPDRLLSLAESFTPWERENFLGNALAGWSARGEKEAGEAISWMKDHWDQIPAAARPSALSGWAAGSADKALEEIAATSEASRRMEMIPAVAAALGHADTGKAVAWADSLSDAGEREAAHAAIYEAVPRGIGVMFRMSGGMPYLEDVMPGGAAADAGLIPGDRMVSVTGPDGNEVSLHGGSMTEVAENLRGNAGETVRIRVLRTYPSGATSELILPVTRRQLVMK